MLRRWRKISPKAVKLPEYKFTYFLCKLFGKTPSQIEEMNIDHVERAFLHYAWAEEQREKAELLRNNSILAGSFYNPEAARKMLDDNKMSSTDAVEDVDLDVADDVLGTIKPGEQEDMPQISHRRRRRIR